MMSGLKKIGFPLLMVLFFGVSAFAQNVNVTATGGTTTATYPTVKAAFDAVNAGMHSGVITVNIAANTTENDSAVLNGNGAGGASYTSIIVRPAVDGIIKREPTNFIHWKKTDAVGALEMKVVELADQFKTEPVRGKAVRQDDLTLFESD